MQLHHLREQEGKLVVSPVPQPYCLVFLVSNSWFDHSLTAQGVEVYTAQGVDVY